MDKPGENYDVLIKLLTIGDSGVGKTCLLMRFAKDEHKIDHIPTLGIDFKLKMTEIDGTRVKLQLWDTAGQERFKTITSTLYQGTHGILVVYSVTDERSFRNVDNWMQQIADIASKNVKVALLGNKTDLIHKRKIQYEDGQKLADKYNCSFFEVSAFDGTNVTDAFTSLTSSVLKAGIVKPEGDDVNLEDYKKNGGKKKKKKKKCKCG